MTAIKRIMAASTVALAFILGIPVIAGAGGATLYELTENMMLNDLQAPTLRTASAALQGSANIGTPLCPAALLTLAATFGLPTGTSCVITAFGEDAISLADGRGSFTGKFAVVVNADNRTDAAELVVMTGTFQAGMQVLADAQGRMLPLIQIVHGRITPVDVFGIPVAYVDAAFPGLKPEMFAAAPFAGVFRLPFALNKTTKHRPQRGKDAFYLDDAAQIVKVGKDELSLGLPTVRVDIRF